MAAVTVSYSIVNRSIRADGYREHIVDITMDGGTYETGGVAYTAVGLGFPSVLRSVSIIEGSATTGTVWKADQSALKLVGYESGTASADLDELDDAADTPSDVVRVLAVGY
jgi:hypothetical protein